MRFKDFLKESKDDAEEWLSSYTLENIDKYPTEEIRQTLLTRYPYEGGTLYRGLNFESEEQYNKFLEQTENGTKMKSGSISSWTPHVRESRSFAITRPTYFLNHSLMQAESQKNKDRDFMIGHAGVILETTVGEGVGIDVRKSKHGKETEVILIPGDYDIKIFKTFIPFMKSINDKNVKQEFLSIKDISGDDEKIDAQKFEHIMFRFKDFDSEMSSHLFKLLSKTLSNPKFVVDVEEQTDFGTRGWDSKLTQIDIMWNISPAFFLYYNLLHESDRAKIDLIVKKLIKQMDAEFQQKTKDLDWAKTKVRVRVSPSIQYAAQNEHINPTFLKKIYKGSGERYNALNSLDNVRAINKLPADKRQDAIKDMTDNIMRALQNIAGN